MSRRDMAKDMKTAEKVLKGMGGPMAQRCTVRGRVRTTSRKGPSTTWSTR